MGQISVVLTGDEARLIRALDRVVQKEREVAEAGKQAGEQTAQSFVKVENAFGRAFGAGAVGTLGAWAVAIKGAQMGLEAIEAVYGRIQKAQDDAAKNAIAAGNAQAALGKYAAGNPALGAALSKAANDTAKESGMSPEAAAKLIGEMAQGGYKGGDDATRSRAWRMQKLGIEHAGTAAMDLSRLGGSGGRNRQGQSVGYMGEAAALAAATSPGTMGELIEGTTDNNDLAKSLGVSTDELMASIASAGQAAGSTKTGAGQVKAFMGALKARGFKGSLEDAVKQFGGIKTSDEHLSKIVGGKEGLAFLRSQQAESGAHLLGRMGEVSSDEGVLGVMGGNVDVQLADAHAAAAGDLRDSMTDQGRLRANADRVRAEEYAADVKRSGGVGLGTEVRRINNSLEPDALVNYRSPIGSGPSGDTAPSLLGGLLAGPKAAPESEKKVIEVFKKIESNTRGKAETLFPGDRWGDDR